MQHTNNRRNVRLPSMIGALAGTVLAGVFLISAPASAAPSVAHTGKAFERVECAKMFAILINNEPQTESSSLELYKNIIVYPGSSKIGELAIRNDGPTPATFIVSFANTMVKSDPQSQFYQDFLFGGQSLTSIMTNDFIIKEQNIAQGATALVDIGYALPTDIDYQYDAEASSMEFDLRITMTGQASASETEISGPCASGEASITPRVTSSLDGVVRYLSQTGVDAFWALLATSGITLVVGTVLVFTRRRAERR